VCFCLFIWLSPSFFCFSVCACHRDCCLFLYGRGRAGCFFVVDCGPAQLGSGCRCLLFVVGKRGLLFFLRRGTGVQFFLDLRSYSTISSSPLVFSLWGLSLGTPSWCNWGDFRFFRARGQALFLGALFPFPCPIFFFLRGGFFPPSGSFYRFVFFVRGFSCECFRLCFWSLLVAVAVCLGVAFLLFFELFFSQNGTFPVVCLLPDFFFFFSPLLELLL